MLEERLWLSTTGTGSELQTFWMLLQRGDGGNIIP
jgi:hypothetical protein